ncbi:MAG: S-adenosylmethionine:tRNA ribosyltransferase-isomerase [Bacteroidetes bacterium]|nr:MAG: S-adenosylmethionine:tRNA ribosyltransferase-isomerase [Bacteroidota bacterium]
MADVRKILIEAYDYPLQEHQIARYPLEQRDQSKLLLQLGKKISEDTFSQLGHYLPSGTLLITNETKVIQARLHFKNANGASIEVFCLEPVENEGDSQINISSKSPVKWKCFVGNSKRWKSDSLRMEINPSGFGTLIEVKRLEKKGDHSIIEFSWDNQEITFGQILETAGELPLPPYLNRKAENSDSIRYQTIFAQNEGSVAAPTASLHFSKEVVDSLKSKGISFTNVTLHVGAGTFKPVSTDTIGEHDMHAERIFVSRATVEKLLSHLGKPIIPIGTTSMRTIESLYWIGLKLLKDEITSQVLKVDQWTPYKYEYEASTISAERTLQAILMFMDTHNLNEIHASTSVMIAPGYTFKIATGLITNFHQPKSTLLLLVSALIGDQWKDVYDYALRNNFRFLSYGDSCLFIP